jgi:phage shock protein PspC (stress-responsive transcriptional regulator)
MSKLISKKLLIAIIGVIAGLAIVFGLKPSEVSTIAGALTIIITAVAHMVSQTSIDKISASNALTAAQSIAQIVAPNSPVSKIPVETITNGINTSVDAAAQIADVIISDTAPEASNEQSSQ